MLINYENYTVGSCFNRKSMLHGGSLILIKNCIKFKQRNDIVGLSVEHCVELSCPVSLTTKPEVVGSIPTKDKYLCDEHEYLFWVWE